MSPFLIYGDERLNLAVAEFEARNVSQMDAVTISDFLRTELVKSGAFNVVDRSNMQKILAEQKFQMAGCTSEECAVQMGKILNVQKIITGSLSRLAGIYYITSGIVDVETGQMVFSERIESKLETDLVKGIEKLAGNLSKSLKGKRTTSLDEQIISQEPEKIPEKKEKLEVKPTKSTLIEKISPKEEEPSKEKIKLQAKSTESITTEKTVHNGRLKVFRIGVVTGSKLDYGVYCDLESSSAYVFELLFGEYLSGTRTLPAEYTYGSGIYRAEIVCNNLFIFKAFLNNYSPLRFSLGGGVSYGKRNWVEPVPTTLDKEKSYSSNVLVPVLDATVDLFASSSLSIRTGAKYFVGGEVRGINLNFWDFSVGLSLNW